ncbi:unnamed protein product [Kluyveromyces dobzhanskii CBS 2104]|uniref:WGS project CCBQ000000000 data, contig 00105 n=1 Tax=Kluyveromyces dobzhanskii CBS 2104 TaxID=1427455 RepID=A0A0A8KZR2_9SACH|nr:unnamed protein product [Kluyveromyces dobzhanskii CBS 2104]
MSSRTRYYLEQCIPEVDDLVQKKLFTKNEVNKVMKKRTDFEHRLSSRGSSISDYIRYIEYEKNVDALRVKRVKRILQSNRSNSISDFTVQQRILYIFQRGCNKFPKELKFWSLYLNHLKSKGTNASYKKVQNVYNQLLKLHPTNVEVWISCAKYEYEVHANFKSCRNVFQTGLRFNPDASKLWYEYVKFELNFVTKLLNRRKVMNLINEREQELDMVQQQEEARNLNTKEEQGGNEDDEAYFDKDGIKLPSTGDIMKDKLNELPEADLNMLGSEETNPALRGDVALVIFDVAMKNLGTSFVKKHQGYYAVSNSQVDEELSRNVMAYLFDRSIEYIGLFSEFQDLKRGYLVNHVLQWLKDEHYNISLEKSMPDKYVELLLHDITLNIRFMPINEFNIESLQLSFKKYSAYTNKLDKTYTEQLTSLYSNYLTQHLLSNMDKSDEKYAILNAIIRKL